MEAILEQERKASMAKDARHKLTVERLRRQIVELQVRCLHVGPVCLSAMNVGPVHPHDGQPGMQPQLLLT